MVRKSAAGKSENPEKAQKTQIEGNIEKEERVKEFDKTFTTCLCFGKEC